MGFMINNLDDLLDFFGAMSPGGLNKSVYKNTSCGASISVKTPDGRWHHNGEDWGDVSEIIAFSVQTIVEGSDATVDCDPFTLPVDGDVVDAAIQWMEEEAKMIWEEANGIGLDDDDDEDYL